MVSSPLERCYTEFCANCAEQKILEVAPRLVLTLSGYRSLHIIWYGIANTINTMKILCVHICTKMYYKSA